MTIWTPENVELASRLWAEGLSASQIAVRLGKGCSRNAVIGKMYRLGGSTTPRKVMPRAPAPPKSTCVPSRPTVQRTFSSRPLRTHKTAPAPKPYRPGKPAGILDVSGCRFPISISPNVIGGHLFCNAEVKEGISYCEHHAGIAFNAAPLVKFTPRTPAHRRAVKLARYGRREDAVVPP